MSSFLVTAFVNVDEQNFFGWKPEHPVAEVGTFAIAAPDAHAAAEAMFDIGNRMAVDAAGQSWPSDVRSLSVGDVVDIRLADDREARRLAVASFDWTETGDQRNPVVALDGSRATSRPAR